MLFLSKVMVTINMYFAVKMHNFANFQSNVDDVMI